MDVICYFCLFTDDVTHIGPIGLTTKDGGNTDNTTMSGPHKQNNDKSPNEIEIIYWLTPQLVEI